MRQAPPGRGGEPRAVLGATRRWPTWMWANEDVVAFAEWLRRHNAGLAPDERVGFYGIDVYGLWQSLRARAWNVRDEHMADTLDALPRFTGRKAVVWEHNTHVGDARATDMAAAGMVNVGQLARERHGAAAVVVVGLGGHRGGVVPAPAWGAAMRAMVPAARADSVEALPHERVGSDAVLGFDGNRPDWAERAMPHRAIGVVYSPEGERYGNHVPSVLAARYDVFVHLEHTTPVRPPHGEPGGEGEDGTWPWAV